MVLNSECPYPSNPAFRQKAKGNKVLKVTANAYKERCAIVAFLISLKLWHGAGPSNGHPGANSD